MLRLKLINMLLYTCGGLNGVVAVSGENTLLTIVTALCGVLTVILSILLTSYIAHISDRESHIAPAYPKGTSLVTDATCIARSSEIKAVVTGVENKVDLMHEDLRRLVNRVS